MTFKQVNEVPKPKARAAKHDLRGMLKEFVESDKKTVKVVYVEGEYKSPRVAYSCMQVAVKRHKFPVRVYLRDGEIYLKKK